MRIMPFMNRKNGVQFAGVGLDTGGGGGGGGGSNITFSTDEFETGMTWIDGKAIYGKVVNGFLQGDNSQYGVLSGVNEVCFILPLIHAPGSSNVNYRLPTDVNANVKNTGVVDVRLVNTNGNNTSTVILFYTKR